MYILLFWALPALLGVALILDIVSHIFRIKESKKRSKEIKDEVVNGVNVIVGKKVNEYLKKEITNKKIADHVLEEFDKREKRKNPFKNIARIK